MIERLKIVPITISVILTIALYYFSCHLSTDINYSKFFELFITAFSILIGFLLTTATILNSFRNEKMDFIKKSGGMKSMNNSLKTSIYSGFIAIFLSIVFFLFQNILKDLDILKHIIIGFNILAMLLCLSFMRTFLRIITPE